jgi:SAM-dependent methyltransferase
LIDRLVSVPGARVLDVGAGTGISSVQLTAAGADVLAVEPDPQMADVCAGKGIPVERSTFECWDPAGRAFDQVVFGQSFHWVDPESALPKLVSIVPPGGRLALMWNQIAATGPKRAELERVYAEFGIDTPASNSESNAETALRELLAQSAFTVERVEVAEDLEYRADDWLGMVFTYSNHLVLDPATRAELRERLRDVIGTGGVDASNRALALVCTR